jgi:hypothetical protein
MKPFLIFLMNFVWAKLKFVINVQINLEIALYAIFIDEGGIFLPINAQFKNSK